MSLQISPEKTRIGWIGTGVMGVSMCGHVLDGRLRGHGVQPHAQAGRAAAGAGRDVGRHARRRRGSGSDVVFTIVGYPADVREVILGTDGALAGRHAGRGARRHDDERAVAGGRDCRGGGEEGRCVDRRARLGRRRRRRGTRRCRSWSAATRTRSSAFGRCSRRWGRRSFARAGPGAGQHTKMVNQMLIASGMIGVCEALLYAYKAGLDLETVLESVAPGAAG